MAEKTKIRFGILHKVTLTMLLISMIPLFLVWFVNYENSSNRIVQHVERYSNEVLERLTTYVDGWVDMNVRMLRQNSMLPDITSMEAERQNPTLELITQIYDWNYLAFTVALNGDNVGRSDGKTPKFYGDRVYVQDVLAGKPLGKQVLIGKTSGKPAFVFAVAIHDEPLKTSGVLAIAMSITDISERVAGAKVGETGFAFLVDETGKVIAHPSQEMSNSRQDLAAHPAVAAAIAGSSSIEFTDDDGRLQIAHMRRTLEGWYMIVQQQHKEAFAELDKANRTSLILLLITMILVTIVAVLFSRRISGPIVHLTEVSNELSRGRMDVTIQGGERGDEIGELARSIGRLGSSIRLAMDRLTRNRKAQK